MIPKNHYEDEWFNSYRNECILKNYYYSEESFPYQLIQRKLPSEGLIVNPITNSADKSPKNYRKSFLTKLCKSSFEKWTTSANWSYWFKHHIKWITAQIWSPKFDVTSRRSMTWHEPQFHCDHCKNRTHLRRELKKHKKTLSSFQSQCIRCMTNVTSRQKFTGTPVSLWSLQKQNSFETRA